MRFFERSLWAGYIGLALVLGGSARAQSAQPAAGEGDPAVMAAQLQAQGKVQSAIPLYQKALASDPSRVNVWINLGAAEAQVDDFAAAIQADERALRLEPTAVAARLNLALAYYKSDRYDQAREALLLYRRQQPDERSRLLLADCDLRLGKNADVVKLLAQESPSGAQQPVVLYLKGTAELRLGDTAAGEREIESLLRHGNPAMAHLMIGEAAMDAHDFKRAVAEFTQAAQQDPTLPHVFLQLGEAQLLSGDSSDALDNLRKEYAADPSDFETNFYLGLLYKQNGAGEHARPYLERALQMYPGLFSAALQLAMIDLDAGHLQDARTRIETLVAAHPDDAQSHVVLGQIYARLHLVAQAKQQRDLAQQLAAKAQRQAVARRQAQSDLLSKEAGKGSEAQ